MAITSQEEEMRRVLLEQKDKSGFYGRFQRIYFEWQDVDINQLRGATDRKSLRKISLDKVFVLEFTYRKL